MFLTISEAKSEACEAVRIDGRPRPASPTRVPILSESASSHSLGSTDVPQLEGRLTT